MNGEIIVSLIASLVWLTLVGIWLGHLLANLWELAGGPSIQVRHLHRIGRLGCLLVNIGIDELSRTGAVTKRYPRPP